MYRLSLAAAAALLAFAPISAEASTMPKADFGLAPTVGVGLGNGLGVSIDAPMGSNLAIGASAHLAYFNAVGLEGRLMYKLARADKLQIDLLAGVNALGIGGVTLAPGIFAGVGLAYPFTNKFTGRLNVAVNVLSPYSYNDSGLELGYKFTNTLEGTIGGYGYGEFLGLKLYI